MSRAKNAIGPILALLIFGGVLIAAEPGDVATSPSYPGGHAEVIKSAVAIDDDTVPRYDVGPDELYFDCLADNPVECRALDMPEESGCFAHQTCIDRCQEEGAGHLCYVDCDAMYLGIGSLAPESSACYCELCAQACSEQCYCEEMF